MSVKPEARESSGGLVLGACREQPALSTVGVTVKKWLPEQVARMNKEVTRPLSQHSEPLDRVSTFPTINVEMRRQPPYLRPPQFNMTQDARATTCQDTILSILCPGGWEFLSHPKSLKAFHCLENPKCLPVSGAGLILCAPASAPALASLRKPITSPLKP